MTSAAARQRLYRQRQRAGRAVLPVEADLVALEQRLLDVGLLRAAEVEDKDALARALQRVVELWISDAVTHNDGGF